MRNSGTHERPENVSRRWSERRQQQDGRELQVTGSEGGEGEGRGRIEGSQELGLLSSCSGPPRLVREPIQSLHVYLH